MTVTPALLAGRYRLREALGSGGMGRVWLARDEVLHRDVAIKEVNFPAELSATEREELQIRTLREARTAARLSHPNVVQIYDVLGVDDRPWIVMEYVRSRSLQQVLQREGTVDPRRAANIGLAVLGALDAAHRAGVLHRDVKPGNVLIAEDDGRVVLTDFGLATFDGGEGSVTRPGLVWGSPEYVAPERARFGVSSAEADLWSLGATLYAAVEGASPYARTSAMATLTALATEKPPAPQQAGVLKPVLTGLLRKDPRARLRPTELARMLHRIADPEARVRSRRLPRQRPVASDSGDQASAMRIASYALPEPPTEVIGAGPAPEPEPGPPPPGRRGWLAAIAVVLLIAGVAGVAVYLAADRRAGQRPDLGSFVAASPSAPARFVTASSPQPGDLFALPAGWGYHREPGRFSIAAPIGWEIVGDGDVVQLREPRSTRRLTVELLPALPAGPVAGVEQREAQWRASGDGPRNYQRTRLVAIVMFAAGAEWEYTYDDPAPEGGTMSVFCRWFVVDGRTYAVSWSSRTYDFGSRDDFYNLAIGSFRP